MVSGLAGHTRHSRALIRGRVKYIANRIPPFSLFEPAYLASNIRTFYKFRADELYFLDRDPSETLSLVESEADTAGQYRGQLIDHIMSSSAPVGALPNPGARPTTRMIEELRSLGYLQ